MRLIDADRLLTDRMKSKYYHLPNGDIAIPIIDIKNAPTIDAKPSDKGGDAEMRDDITYLNKPYMQQSPDNGADLISRADAIEAVKKEIQDFEANYMHGEDDEEYGHDIGFVAGLYRAKTFIRALPSADAKGANLINRHDATTVIREECWKCNKLINADLLGRILALPTSRQTDCTEFIMWLIEVILDDEDWELNAVGYGEIIARKLKKLGLLEVKDGYYIRHIENNAKESDLVYRPSADAEPKWNCTANFVAEQLDRLRNMTDEEKWEFFRKFFGMGDAVQGEWEHWGSPFSDESEVIDTIVCSVCGARFIEPKDEPKGEYNYCPNCGARMKGGAE